MKEEEKNKIIVISNGKSTEDIKRHISDKCKELSVKDINDQDICDDKSAEAISLYVKKWGKSLSSNRIDYIYKKGKDYYSPESIFSFKTLAGAIIRTFEGFGVKFKMPAKPFERLQVLLDSPELDVCKKISILKYYCRCFSLGNFMPLAYGEGGASLNKLKGNNKTLMDFPEKFLPKCKEEYDKYMDDNVIGFSTPPFCHPFIKDEYFLRFKSEGVPSWKGFVEGNYLQDFFEDKEDKKYEEFAIDLRLNSKKPDSEKHDCDIIFAWDQYTPEKMSPEQKKESREAIIEYFDKASEIIRNRSKRLQLNE
jgi:hypothetical protein